ncbi:MAG: permease prefix domain 1-containing protein, partial [Thermoleophilia bacterium]
MASTHLSEPDQRPTGGDPLAEYLATVSARLPGPTAARTTITDELRDGLLEALEANQAQGRSPQEATAAAIADFGDPRRVAAAFAPEL